jgi:hypothetical protein
MTCPRQATRAGGRDRVQSALEVRGRDCEMMSLTLRLVS